MKLKVKAVAVTPLMQIESTEKRPDAKSGHDKNVTKIKTRYVIEDDSLVKIPIYTGNGFRGLLRRKMSEIILEEATKKGIKIDTTNYFMMVAGGGANYQKQEFSVLQKVKELNPVISILGTSLAVPGKLIVTDLIPDYKDFLYFGKSKKSEEEETDDNNEFADIESASNNLTTTPIKKCALIKERTFTKKDDILAQTKYGRFLSSEDIKKWEDIIEEEKVKDKEKDSDRLTIQSILNAEYIVPGAKFTGYITAKDDLTNIEYGLLLRAIANLTEEFLGAGSSMGFGIMNYNIYDNDKISDKNRDGEEVVTSLVDSENLLSRKLSITEREYELNCIAAFDKWLNDITEDNIDIARLMKSSSEKKAQKTEKAKAKKAKKDEEESEE
jgi:CRISPR type IV-associated protein Csf2